MYVPLKKYSLTILLPVFLYPASYQIRQSLLPIYFYITYGIALPCKFQSREYPRLNEIHENQIHILWLSFPRK